MSHQVNGGCSVCKHPSVLVINKHLQAGRQYRWIEANYFVTRSSISRHKRGCLKLNHLEVMKSVRVDQQVDVYLELVEQLNLLKRMRDAAEEYLTDPNDPMRFCMNPRADEITVIFYRFDNDPLTGEVKRTRHRAKLSELQGTIEEQHPGISVRGFSVKATDMRKYILDLVNSVDQCLTQFAKIEGLYTKDRDNAASIETGIKAFKFFLERNPEASLEQQKEAMGLISAGINVSLSDLEQRLGVEDRTEIAVQ